MMFGISLPIKLLIGVGLLIAAMVFAYRKGAENSELELANFRVTATKQISDLKSENIRLNERAVTTFITKTNNIRQKEIVYRELSDGLEPQYDLSNGWIHLHDAAAKLANPDLQLATDAAPSGVMDNAALSVVITNYAICRQNSEQLTELQQWIRDNQAAIDKVNAEKAKGKG